METEWRWFEDRAAVCMLTVGLCLHLLLRLPHYVHEFVFIDEAWWAMGSQAIANGNRLYADFWMDKQPPIFLLGALLFRIFGQHMAVLHALAVALAMLTSLLLYRIGARFFSPEAGGAAALLYSLASTSYYPQRILGLNVESLMIVFTVAAAYFFLEARRGGRLSDYLLAGCLSAMGGVTKPVAGLQTALFLCLILFRSGNKPAVRVKGAVAFGVGSLAAILLLVAYLASTGALQPWWSQCILYSVTYVHQVPAAAFLRRLFRDPAAFLLVYAWLCILIWRGLRDTSDSAARTTIAAWMVADFAGVALGRRFYSNYYVQIWPSMCLLGGLGAVELWKSRRTPLGRRLLRAATVSFLAVFLWFHARTAVHWAIAFNPALHSRVEFWGTCRENRELGEIAAQIRSRSFPEDTLFIWGSRAELYWLAQRKPAYFCIDYDVNADVPDGAAEPWRRAEAVSVLRRSPPRYIVDVTGNVPIENYPDFGDLLRERYELESRIHRARLFRLR